MPRIEDGAYYNEIDPKAAAWLRELIAQGHIAPGEVDERDIRDIRPDELLGYSQCHFFAGIGVWSYALRRAGWPDDRPVWTGSCPCQPFSAAGKGGGFDDERHLWPAWFWLIEQCRPAIVFGEQVASKDAEPWIDLVQDDLEAVGYGVGAVPFPAAGIGAPHIRDRLYWVADTGSEDQGGRRVQRPGEGDSEGAGAARERPAGLRPDGGVAPADGGHPGAERQQRSGEQRQQPQDGGAGGLADTDRRERDGVTELRGVERNRQDAGRAESSRELEPRRNDDGLRKPGRHFPHGTGTSGDDGLRELALRPGPVNGLWRDADWLLCRDGKWRPVEASPQPMVDGSAPSLGRVRDSCAAEFQEEIDAWSVETQSERAASLRTLLQSLAAQAQPGWQIGRLPGLHEAAFLLAFVRQLQEQGWTVAEGIALSCSEAALERVRVLRRDLTAPSASRERGLVGQPPDEPTDPLHLLSSLLARHASAAWSDAHAAYAEIGFPIGHGAPARVGRLRGYGNAIVAQAATEVIAAFNAYLEINPGTPNA